MPKSPRRSLLQREPLSAIKGKPVPHEFVLEALDQVSPRTRPMFGCLAVYVGERIVLVLRDKPTYPGDNGVWLATTLEHHESLRRDFPNMRSIELLGKQVTGWQVLPVGCSRFRASCAARLRIHRGRRFPHRQSAGSAPILQFSRPEVDEIPQPSLISRVQSHSEMADSPPRKLIIAIDGPAGAGKSTIASRLARKLGYVNLESGAMYRALALKAIENDISFDDEAALAGLAQNSRIKLEPTIGGNRVMLDGRDVTQRVRESDVSQAASRVSVHPKVREWMVAKQRQMGAEGAVVMEGRDIGTVVFPHADVKIFLDADPVIREQRRLKQQPTGGAAAESMAAELRERDRRDRTRANSPLEPALDAMVLDSTSLSEDEVLERVEELVEKKLK